MIVYSPLDGDAVTFSIPSNALTCFLITKLVSPVPDILDDIRQSVSEGMTRHGFSVIDATAKVTGRDFLLKILRMIASSPLSIAVAHDKIPPLTQANIWYELGMAQAMGKETIVIKTPTGEVPSDFVRTEYIEFDERFAHRLDAYMSSLKEQAQHYALMADQLDRNPVLAIDYLRRAYLLTGDESLKKRAKAVVEDAHLQDRAANSVELLAAAF
jgi:hypothetical protein